MIHDTYTLQDIHIKLLIHIGLLLYQFLHHSIIRNNNIIGFPFIVKRTVWKNTNRDIFLRNKLIMSELLRAQYKTPSRSSVSGD